MSTENLVASELLFDSAESTYFHFLQRELAFPQSRQHTASMSAPHLAAKLRALAELCDTKHAVEAEAGK